MNEKWLQAEQKSERKYFVTSFCYGSTVEFLRGFEDSKKKKKCSNITFEPLK